jgi:hypothetical protein
MAVSKEVLRIAIEEQESVAQSLHEDYNNWRLATKAP